MSDQVIFIYKDVKGKITARTVIDISENEDFLQGHCCAANALRTFRKDRMLEILDSDEGIDSILAHYIATNPAPREVVSSGPRGPFKPSHLLDICFTGFLSEDKKRLKKQAEAAGFVIRSSVTKNLSFLCCGYNAGPKKIDKARKQGAVSLSEEELQQLMETGEIPDS